MMKKLNKRIGFIGAGNMGEAMIHGLIKSGLCKASEIYASDVRDARLRQLQDTYKIHTNANNMKVFDQVDVVVLAVKPQHMAGPCQRFSTDNQGTEAHHIDCRRFSHQEDRGPPLSSAGSERKGIASDCAGHAEHARLGLGWHGWYVR
jgi:hypothetical protein